MIEVWLTVALIIVLAIYLFPVTYLDLGLACNGTCLTLFWETDAGTYLLMGLFPIAVVGLLCTFVVVLGFALLVVVWEVVEVYLLTARPLLTIFSNLESS